MNFIKRWLIKRELKKSAKLIEKLCDEAPNSFFEMMKDIVVDSRTGLPAKNNIEARNNLMDWARHLKRMP